MNTEQEKPQGDVIAWIIESKAGVWTTANPAIAEKHRDKKGSVVTEYRSKLGVVL